VYETLTDEDWAWLEKLAAVPAGAPAREIPKAYADRLIQHGFVARSDNGIAITEQGLAALNNRRNPARP
jgi:hypothetical protein